MVLIDNVANSANSIASTAGDDGDASPNISDNILDILCPGRRAEYCDQSVCLFVCPDRYPQNHVTDLRQIFVHIPRGPGSVFLWWRCDTLCTSGFVDDVMLAIVGRIAYFDQLRGGVLYLRLRC